MLVDKNDLNIHNTEYFNSNYTLSNIEENYSYMKDFWVFNFLF